MARARNLRTLDLTDTRITDQGVARLRELRKLQILNLYGTRVTEESADSLATMPGLTEVLFPNTEAGSRARKRLKVLNPTITVD